MKPSFALNLSHDGISLLHRSPGGWHLIGDVDLQSPDMPNELRFLRQSAVALAAGQMTTKLVLPESQILYTEFEIATGPDADCVAEIGHSLVGMTPYAVEDLVFDWERQGQIVRVAAVAKETLEEAEHFAIEHNFNPLSFAAVPKHGQFGREPFFGATKTAATLLSDGEKVEPDVFPIKIVPMPEVAPMLAVPPAPTPLPDERDATRNGKATDVLDPKLVLGAASSPEPKKDGAKDAQTASATPAFSSRRNDEPTETPSAAAPLTATVEPRFAIQPTKSDIEQSPPQSPPASVTQAIAPDMPLAATPKDTKPSEPDTPKVPPAPAPIVAAQSAEKLARFGEQPQRGKPRFLGLILTAALVFVMVMVAFWMTFGPTENATSSQPAPEETQASDLSAEPDVAEPQPIPEIAEVEPIEIAPLPTEDELDAAYPEVPRLSDAEVNDTYASSGIWLASPTSPGAATRDTLNSIYVPSIDPVISSFDAVALPRLERNIGATLPATQHDPAVAGTEFALDEQGRVIPTAEGALNANGIRVFAGRPNSTTPPRVLPEVTETEIETAEAQNPLAAFRPVPRPTDLQERQERALYAGLTREELASFRPTPRPVSAQEIAIAAADAAAASLQEQAATEEDTSEQGTLSDDSEFAMATSLLPSRRPEGFSALVAQIRESRSADEADTSTRDTASTAVGRAPSIPTRASVAQQATVENAINLRRISLIGIYGSTSNPQAMVRLRNGRYVRLSVGDRLDGGQVAAIGQDELRYVKRGRNVTLEMPNT
ncbi:hypothetical protein [Cochlodiniinecator piscidefendens]|uniref:hypothetical protein n=1 Tax=Cochlodiniinecator piscidefendens TaxID=2715756 RepID=UPI0014073C03|nr:hypothetical protein [Cochlodiniinecator piscidefendens]